MIETLPILDLDHPGAKDEGYTKRRKKIVKAAIEFHSQKKRIIPLIDYTQEEHKVWCSINEKLRPLHEKWACSLYKKGRKKLNLDKKKIPQLQDISNQLKKIHGFTLEPIHGLVDSRIFFSKLGKKTMLCTQYIRHYSRPEFTPEPDIIHEILGHIPTFTNKKMIEFSQILGRAAENADADQLKKLERLYWFTVEYGLIQDEDGIKAFGAGLLGGIQDLKNAFNGKSIIKEFKIKEVLETEYNYSFEQPVFFVIPSFNFLVEETRKLIDSFSG